MTRTIMVPLRVSEYGDHLLAVRRYQRAVPVLPGEPVRGGRFTATCQAGLGLLVGSTSVYRLPATLGDLTLQIDSRH